jgi:hypothetical protein
MVDLVRRMVSLAHDWERPFVWQKRALTVQRQPSVGFRSSSTVAVATVTGLNGSSSV